MAATKINHTKLACAINANAVRGRSCKKILHENLSYESFFTRNFQIYGISSMVLHNDMHVRLTTFIHYYTCVHEQKTS